MSEEQVRVVRRRRSRAEAAELVAQYEASGLEREEFCHKHGLSLATLGRYRKWQRQGRADAEGGNRWVAVEVSGSHSAAVHGAGSGLALMLKSGLRIEVGRGFDPKTLERLVHLLEQV